MGKGKRECGKEKGNKREGRLLLLLGGPLRYLAGGAEQLAEVGGSKLLWVGNGV